ITALNAEKVVATGRKIDSVAAKEFIKENIHARFAGAEEDLPITIRSGGNPTVELALRRTIGTFSNSEDGDFRYFLKRILLENQILLDGDRVRISHVGFPRYMTQKQMNAVRDRITEEIRLYAPRAEVVFSKFPVLHGGEY
ncbi:MAG: hypothetical protein ACE5JO_07085, partial [Candidatus Binatia bacterium]